MTDPIDYTPDLSRPPPENAAYPPHAVRVRRGVFAEQEVALAAAAGHAASWRTLNRGRHPVDRDNTSPEPAPDGITYRDIGGGDTGVLIGPFVNGPYATHVEMYIHYRSDDTATGAPTIDITLEEADALDGTNIDAPVAAAAPGLRLTGNAIPGDEDNPASVTVHLGNVEDTPTSYPSDGRMLEYLATADDTLCQIRVAPTNVDIIAIDWIERIFA